MIERMNEKLGRPQRCPHGWPVDPEREQAENRELVALAELGTGEHAEIVRLAEHDGDLLHWFYDEGFTPGTWSRCEEAQPGRPAEGAAGWEARSPRKRRPGCTSRRRRRVRA